MNTVDTLFHIIGARLQKGDIACLGISSCKQFRNLFLGVNINIQF